MCPFKRTDYNVWQMQGSQSFHGAVVQYVVTIQENIPAWVCVRKIPQSSSVVGAHAGVAASVADHA